MIVYALTCAAGHRFDAWLPGSEAFEVQRRDGSLSCPVCGDGDVRKAPMAPRVARSGPAPARSADEGSDAPAVQPAVGADPAAAVPEAFAQLVTLLRRQLETSCEDVGERFPEEARRIHYGESEQRAIFGEASAEEASELRDEGIAVEPIPWFHRRNG